MPRRVTSTPHYAALHPGYACCNSVIPHSMRWPIALPHPAGIDDRTGIGLEGFTQFGDLRLIGEEAAVVVHDVVRQDRLDARRRRHVAAGRPRGERGLLLGRKKPG